MNLPEISQEAEDSMSFTGDTTLYGRIVTPASSRSSEQKDTTLYGRIVTPASSRLAEHKDTASVQEIRDIR